MGDNTELAKELLDQLKASLQAEVKKGEEKRKCLEVPKLEKKAFQAQVEFNVKVMGLLVDSKDASDDVDKALELLKERNKLLTAADKNPAVFETYDLAEKLKSSSSDSSQLSSVLLASALSGGATSRKRRYEPFPQRGSEYGKSLSPNTFAMSRELDSLRRQVANGRNGRYDSQPAKTQTGVQCYRCFQYGHTRPQCRSKLW